MVEKRLWARRPAVGDSRLVTPAALAYRSRRNGLLKGH